MVHSLLAKNVKEFETAIADSTSFVDINYEVIPKNPKHTTVVKDEKAILNAYKIWLQSRENDYVRNPGFGGFFDNNLNDRFKFSPDSEPIIAQALKDETTEKWPDIALLEVEIKCDFANREWKVRVIIMDVNTRAIDKSMFDVYAEGLSIRQQVS